MELRMVQRSAPCPSHELLSPVHMKGVHVNLNWPEFILCDNMMMTSMMYHVSGLECPAHPACRSPMLPLGPSTRKKEGLLSPSLASAL
eukprot:1137360-Pelagomonas_calceolata.AAC.10